MGGPYAIAKLLARNNLTLADFAFVEIHEAFASTVLSTLKALADDDFCRTRLGLDSALGEVDRERLNVTGSSLAAGHPFAATGGRIVGTLATLLAERAATDGEKPLGLISVCAAGGQATAMILKAAYCAGFVSLRSRNPQQGAPLPQIASSSRYRLGLAG